MTSYPRNLYTCKHVPHNTYYKRTSNIIDNKELRQCPCAGTCPAAVLQQTVAAVTKLLLLYSGPHPHMRTRLAFTKYSPLQCHDSRLLSFPP